MIRTVFLGSPAAALPSFHALVSGAAKGSVEVVGVVTQPDRPAGRRRKMQACPVKQEAERLGIPVFAPPRIGEEASLDRLREWGVELAIVCAYGQIFPSALLSLPRLGCFNLHFSLLPRWRGASPVQAALLAGDPATGVSLQRMALQLDAGEIVAETAPLPIDMDDTADSLGEKLALASGDLLTRSLPLLLGGDPPLRIQDADAVTFCRTIRKEEGAVDFAAETAIEIERKCRAYTPWPGCFAFLADRRLGLVRMEVVDAPAEVPAETPKEGIPPQPGVLGSDGRIAAREGWLRLLEVKPEGKGAMAFADFRNGNPGAVGARLTPEPAS